MSHNLSTISINNLQANPFQPRDKVSNDDLSELVSSIKTHGILEPLVVAHTPAGYQIIAGERRWRASKIVGLKEVPVHIKETTPKGMLEMALVENVQRVNLSPLERAFAFRKLISDFGFSYQLVADRIGKSPVYVRNTIKLLELPDIIKDGLISKKITEGHARAIGGLKEDSIMVECYKRVLKESASVRRAEELVRHYKEKYSIKNNSNSPIFAVPMEQIKRWENGLRLRLHTKGMLKFNRSTRQTKISIILKGNPAKTQADLDRIMELISKN